MPAPVAYVLDANVLIDYANSDPWVIGKVCDYLGGAGVCTVVLDEADDFTEELVEATGVITIDLTSQQLVEAYAGAGPLSPQDRMCLIAARDFGFTCVTNEKALRRTCESQGVPVLWGLELMVLLMQKGRMAPADAERVANDIKISNPHHITDEILRRFTRRLRGR